MDTAQAKIRSKYIPMENNITTTRVHGGKYDIV